MTSFYPNRTRVFSPSSHSTSHSHGKQHPKQHNIIADNNTPKPPKKKIKTAIPISKSRAMRITDEDIFELKDVTEASEFTGYLSPLGRKLIKKSLESEDPLDLKAINQMVMEKEDGGYYHCQGQPKNGNNEDDENGSKDNENKQASPDGKNAGENINKTDVTKNNNNSEEYTVKDPFIKSNSTKAKEICWSCRIMSCKMEVYGDLLKKLAKDVAGKRHTTTGGSVSIAVMFSLHPSMAVLEGVSASVCHIALNCLLARYILTLAENTLDSFFLLGFLGTRNCMTTKKQRRT